MNIDRQLDSYLEVKGELDRQQEAWLLSQQYAFLIKEYALSVFNILHNPNVEKETAMYVVNNKQRDNLQASKGQVFLFD